MMHAELSKKLSTFFCSEKTINKDWLIVHKHHLSFLLTWIRNQMPFENETLLAYILLWGALSENKYRL